jgi:predicted nuclease of restriction endonuclease-like RecB superfamily
LLPADKVQIRIVGPDAIPLWLGAEDHAWIRALRDDFVRLDGRRAREVRSFFEEPPRVPAPPAKHRMAVWVLQNLCAFQGPPLDAGMLRDAVAVEAQRARHAGRFERAEAMATAAAQFGMSAAEADEHLFADLPAERRLRVPRDLPEPPALAARTNVALAQGLLRLASDVTLRISAGARAVVRQVHLRRLLCTVRRGEPPDIRIDISGAFSLFRHTLIYGRALASIFPLVVWCERFDLTARCVLRGRVARVRLGPGDPIALGEPPRRYDSRLEERFALDFTRATLDWDLVREPEPVQVGDTFMFPDFAIVHRHDGAKRFLLEIVGFWTPDYLREKLERLRAVPGAALVLCIDRSLNCGSGDLPDQARVVWFQKRIEPRAVLAAIEGASPRSLDDVRRIGPGDLFLDWAGRLPSDAPVHRRLDALRAGDALRLRSDGPWLAIDAADGPVAMLSARGRAQWLPLLDRVASAYLVGKVEREAAQSGSQWRQRLQCVRWFVPITDVVLAATIPRLGRR